MKPNKGISFKIIGLLLLMFILLPTSISCFSEVNELKREISNIKEEYRNNFNSILNIKSEEHAIKNMEAIQTSVMIWLPNYPVTIQLKSPLPSDCGGPLVIWSKKGDGPYVIWPGSSNAVSVINSTIPFVTVDRHDVSIQGNEILLKYLDPIDTIEPYNNSLYSLDLTTSTIRRIILPDSARSVEYPVRMAGIGIGGIFYKKNKGQVVGILSKTNLMTIEDMDTSDLIHYGWGLADLYLGELVGNDYFMAVSGGTKKVMSLDIVDHLWWIDNSGKKVEDYDSNFRKIIDDEQVRDWQLECLTSNNELFFTVYLKNDKGKLWYSMARGSNPVEFASKMTKGNAPVELSSKIENLLGGSFSLLVPSPNGKYFACQSSSGTWIVKSNFSEKILIGDFSHIKW